MASGAWETYDPQPYAVLDVESLMFGPGHILHGMAYDRQANIVYIAENYGDGLRQLDLAGAPEQSRVAINDWVSDKTEGKIQDLLPPGSISDWMRLVLTSAIYFDAAWDSPFRRSATHTDVFYPLGGGIVLSAERNLRPKDVQLPDNRNTSITHFRQ